MDSSCEKPKPKHEPNLQIVNGIPFSLLFEKEKIEETLNFKSRESDIILASYPKTGNTWMLYIILQIISNGEFFPTLNDVRDNHVPAIEARGSSAIEALLTRPRFYVTHLPYNMINLHPESKIIYVYRNPEDNFVSFYYFMNNMMGNLDFDQYFEDYVNGYVTHGSYFEHILSYLKRIGNGKILMVSYEKLQTNIRKEILGVAKFLDLDYYQRIVEDEAVLNKIIKHTSFDYMQKNLTLYRAVNPIKHHFSTNVPLKNVEFFRKGEIGDGKKKLADDQLKRLKSLAKEKLRGTHIIEEWYPY